MGRHSAACAEAMVGFMDEWSFSSLRSKTRRGLRSPRKDRGGRPPGPGLERRGGRPAQRGCRSCGARRAAAPQMACVREIPGGAVGRLTELRNATPWRRVERGGRPLAGCRSSGGRLRSRRPQRGAGRGARARRGLSFASLLFAASRLGPRNRSTTGHPARGAERRLRRRGLGATVRARAACLRGCLRQRRWQEHLLLLLEHLR